MKKFYLEICNLRKIVYCAHLLNIFISDSVCYFMISFLILPPFPFHKQSIFLTIHNENCFISSPHTLTKFDGSKYSCFILCRSKFFNLLSIFCCLFTFNKFLFPFQFLSSLLPLL